MIKQFQIQIDDYLIEKYCDCSIATRVYCNYELMSSELLRLQIMDW